LNAISGAFYAAGAGIQPARDFKAAALGGEIEQQLRIT